MLSALSVNALVFSGGEICSQDEPDARTNGNVHTVPEPSSNKTSEPSRSDEEHNVNTYVRVFEGALNPPPGPVDSTHIPSEMVCTVIKEETHLLNDEEFALLTVFAHLSCALSRPFLQLTILT